MRVGAGYTFLKFSRASLLCPVHAVCGAVSTMLTVHDADPEELIRAMAEQLEDEFEAIEQPEWAQYAKTGVDRERPPQQEDWWYIRSAAVLRKLYVDGPLGTQRLRTVYGGKQRRGHQTEHAAKGSGKVIRTVLQQLEAAGLVEDTDGDGRAVTSDGQSFLDRHVKQVAEG